MNFYSPLHWVQDRLWWAAAREASFVNRAFLPDEHPGRDVRVTVFIHRGFDVSLSRTVRRGPSKLLWK